MMNLAIQKSHNISQGGTLMERLPIMAIDASPYAIKAGLYTEGHLQDSFESKPHNLHCLMDFVKECQDFCYGIPVVSSPLDRWPDGLEMMLREHNISVKWLSPELMRSVTRIIAPWNKKRRLHRAGLLAYLFDTLSDESSSDARSLVLSWEAYSARRIINTVNGELNYNSDEDSLVRW